MGPAGQPHRFPVQLLLTLSRLRSPHLRAICQRSPGPPTLHHLKPWAMDPNPLRPERPIALGPRILQISPPPPMPRTHPQRPFNAESQDQKSTLFGGVRQEVTSPLGSGVGAEALGVRIARKKGRARNGHVISEESMELGKIQDVGGTCKGQAGKGARGERKWRNRTKEARSRVKQKQKGSGALG